MENLMVLWGMLQTTPVSGVETTSLAVVPMHLPLRLVKGGNDFLIVTAHLFPTKTSTSWKKSYVYRGGRFAQISKGGQFQSQI